MRRMYKFDGVCYIGFNKYFHTPHRLVLVQDEDVLDVWAIDGQSIQDEMNQLILYLRKAHPNAKLIGTYSEEGFRGFKCEENDVASWTRFK